MFDGMPDQFYQFLASSNSRSHVTTTTTNASLPIPLSFSLHHHHHHHHDGGVFPSSFDSPPFPLSPPPPPSPPPPQLLHHPKLSFQLQQSSSLQHEAKGESGVVELAPIHPWSSDEMLALLRIRSSLDNNWFPDFTWDNVSRKLAEHGFKRSAEQCKEKFEVETRNFNNNSITPNSCNNKNINVINNYRHFGELEELYNSNVDHHHQSNSPPPNPNPNSDQGVINTNDNSNNESHEIPKDAQNDEDDEQMEEEQQAEISENETRNESVGIEEHKEVKRVMRKRKRLKKLEMFKGFCERIVNKMMAQQEELHCRIIQDMVKRDEEKIAKEEAWKKQEIERIGKEMEVRAHELVVAGRRQAKMLDILNKFISSHCLELPQSLGEVLDDFVKVPNNLSNSSILTQDSITTQQQQQQQQPTSSCSTYDQNPSPLVTNDCPNLPNLPPNESLARHDSHNSVVLPIDKASKNPYPRTHVENDKSTHESSRPNHTSTDIADHITEIRSIKNQGEQKPSVGYVKDDTGKRWPRDEVLALINIRCSLFTNNNGEINQDREGSSKGPLWERISRKMLDLGYKRSAKRCKEKWENINKYFRKTKDLNKKRPVDSRTCPYFHQLSHLYSQGNLIGTGDRPSKVPPSPENRPVPLPGVQVGTNTSNINDETTTMLASQDNQGLPAFDFEF